jgi:hypothetical protein
VGKTTVGSEPVKKKRSDYHYTAEDGSLWDSRFEWIFYTAAKEAGLDIFRCTKSNTFSFILPIRGGICGACESALVGQRRTYTPDFGVIPADPQHKTELHYIETKGYLRAKERSLLRSFYKTYPDISLSIILQRTYPVGAKRADGTKGGIVDWFKKFLPNVKVYVWDGKVPTGLRDTAGGSIYTTPKKSTRKGSSTRKSGGAKAP